MMKKTMVVLAGIFFLVSCQNAQKEAQGLIQQAQLALDEGNLSQAKMMIDSMRQTFPEEIESIRSGKKLMWQIELFENQRNLVYADSLLLVRKKELAQEVSKFTFLKEPDVEEMGHYVPKGMEIERNQRKSHLRVEVDEYGGLQLVSVYFSSRPARHTAIKFLLADGSNATTLAIPYDGGRNYRFEDMGYHTEIVTYDQEAQNGVLEFAEHYASEPITVHYVGDQRVTIVMDQATKKRIQDAVHLSQTLSDITRLQQESNVFNGKISFLQKKLGL